MRSGVVSCRLCAAFTLKRGRGKRRASHQVSAESHRSLPLSFGFARRRSGVEMEFLRGLSGCVMK